MDKLPFVEVCTRKKDISASVIWLHGLGADGHDFESIVPELQLSGEVGIRFIFPHAPVRPIAINMNMPMRAWYDVKALDWNVPQDEMGIRASSKLIEPLIKAENERGVPSSRIILAGFSQGGAMALQVGLRFSETLCGILVLSAYLPLADSLPKEASAVNRNIPIMMAHGSFDSMIPIMYAEYSKNYLVHMGYQVDWHTYPMGHELCLSEIHDISQWISNVFK